jgi:hypothetical protein
LQNPFWELRERWIEAGIERDLGRPARAIEIFVSVRDGFLALKDGYDAAFACLELALLHAGKGDFVQAEDLAAEALEIFCAHRIPLDALAALIVVRQAAARRREQSTLAS